MEARTFAPHVWRIRLWIRLLAAGNATIWLSLGGVVLFGVIPMGDNPITGWIALLGLAIVPLYFAWWPRLELRADGQLRFRGWLRRRTTSANLVTDMYMTPYGLRFEFEDAKPFTCVIFQATVYRHYPRYFDTVEAITGVRPPLEGHSPFTLGPSRTSGASPEALRLGRGSVAGLEEIVTENREWVHQGEYRRALDRMRGLLRDHADDLELRRATAQLYRELGNPDQAGRWGFVVPDGATVFEKQTFLKGARQPVSPGFRRLLWLPDEIEVELPEDLPSKSATPVVEWSIRTHFSEAFRISAKAFGVLGLCLLLLANVAVFIAAMFGVSFTDAARTAGGVVAVVISIAAVLSGLSRAASARWPSAILLWLLGVALIFGAAALFSLA